jgi:adenylate cyclase class 2
MFEVEVKARIEDPASIESQLFTLGASFQHTIHQNDTYFQHPLRNFAQTDEALRIRITDDKSYLTYKGPKIDSFSKTREELELEVQDPLKFSELLKKIGLNPIMKVVKTRKSYLLQDISISIDTIEELGNFIELELDVPDKAQVPMARERLFTILAQLTISPDKFERRSYLELLMK